MVTSNDTYIMYVVIKPCLYTYVQLSTEVANEKLEKVFYIYQPYRGSNSPNNLAVTIFPEKRVYSKAKQLLSIGYKYLVLAVTSCVLLATAVAAESKARFFYFIFLFASSASGPVG